MFNWPGADGDMLTLSVQPTGVGLLFGWMLAGKKARTFIGIVPRCTSERLTVNTFGSKSTAKSALLRPARVQLMYARAVWSMELFPFPVNVEMSEPPRL